MICFGYGGLKLVCDWVVLGDIVGSVLNCLCVVLVLYWVQVIVVNDLLLFYVYVVLIEQVLINVLENVVCFLLNYGWLCIEVSQDVVELCFVVSDEGLGIFEVEWEKIFDMFYIVVCGDCGGQGIGLGLVICQGMIGVYGGCISVGEGFDGCGIMLVLYLLLYLQLDFG